MKIPMALLLMILSLTASFTRGETDPRDVTAINSLYIALGNPPLTGWIPNGGDPCFEAWQGVQCVNSNITGIVLRGLNLSGELSVNLDVFPSMIVFDLSDNQIGGTLPINLPLTVRNLFLSENELTGSIPVSLSALTQLTDITFGNNHLDGEIPDVFQALSSLVNLDMSTNNLSGILPLSLKSLLSLTSLDLQNNHLSGTLDVLQDLPLQELNIENNIFSGPIPEKLLGIANFKKDGNPFNTSIIPSAPPPGPIVSLPPLPGPSGSGITHGKYNNGPTKSEGLSPAKTENFWSSKGFKWLAIAVAVVLAIIAFGFLICMLGCGKDKKHADSVSKVPIFRLQSRMEDFDDIESCKRVEKDERRKDDPRIAIPVSGATLNQNHKEKADVKLMGALSKPYEGNDNDMTGKDLSLMPPHEKLQISPIGPTTITTGKIMRKKLNSALSVRAFTVASLQQYTNSFSEENLIGVGSLGSVYRAELPDGKLLAVKKLDTAASLLQSEEEFLDLVASISKLQNGNIVELEGYCMEHGQRLLIYGYYSNGTLHEALHSEEHTEKLSWNARIRIALGSARALEYLHEICHPPVVHRNFKSANVLLDDELAVHVSDCGLAPLISVATLSGQSSSQGYGAPEFEMGTYSCQHDVYSFGVVMLELLTGRKSYDRPRGEQFLVRWAIPQLHDIDALSRMVDPSLNRAYPAKSLSRFADIISLCVQSEPEFRPPMSEIVQDLLHMIQREPPNRL